MDTCFERGKNPNLYPHRFTISLKNYPAVRDWCYKEVQNQNWAILFVADSLKNAMYIVGFKNIEDASYFKLVFSDRTELPTS